jgi:hypothetical protein
VRFIQTRKCDGSIVDFGHVAPTDNDVAALAALVLNAGHVVPITAVTIDMDNGTRVRYEP